jgi:hypothetical protein
LSRLRLADCYPGKSPFSTELHPFSLQNRCQPEEEDEIFAFLLKIPDFKEIFS